MPLAAARTGRLSLVATSVLAIVTIAMQGSSAQIAASRTFYRHDADGEMGGSVIEDIESRRDPAVPRIRLEATRPLYTFFPHAGIEGQDLFLLNFVDLSNASFDHTGPGLDFECTGYSYGGHTGHDSIISGFTEQAIGVPVFAALDGTVYGVHDGEPDQETANLIGRPTNFVALQHAGGYQTASLHLKKGSIAVKLGQTVAAGTQIGLTGSSGDSSWPHLHLTSMLNGVVYEPSSGPCQSGASGWTRQPLVKRETYATSFTFGTQPFTGAAGYPFDEVAHRGAYLVGSSPLYFRIGLRNLPAASIYRFVLTRPDGTVVMDNTGAFTNPDLARNAWFWFSRNVTFGVPGTWTLDISVNGQTVVTAPVSVVPAATSIVNHPPFAVSAVALDPPTPSPSDVPMCLVRTGSLYHRDPDYDVVRYRYRWFVNGVVVRDVTSAGLADAIPSGLIHSNDQLQCEVTPRDQALDGPVASIVAGTPSQQIVAGGSIRSDTGLYRLQYQTDGNVVLVDERSRSQVWSTNTGGTTPGRLVMQDDGDLVLFDGGNRRTWSSNTSGNASAYFSLENDGNLVIYNAGGKRIWDRNNLYTPNASERARQLFPRLTAR